MGSPGSVGMEMVMGRTRLGEEQMPKPSRSVPNQSDSVKGKKSLAHARALKVNSPGTVRAAEEKNTLTESPHTRLICSKLRW